MGPELSLFVSIVIATRNRSALLGQTLEALARQRWPADQLEIIVSDNGSTDDTRAVIERAAGRARGAAVRYLFVTEPGKSHAVNAALLVTRGDLIAFTDDDVQPDPDWIPALARAVEETSADFVAGRIRPIWETEQPAWLSPSLYGVLAIPDNGPARLPIGADTPSNVMPIGANMAVRAAVIARLGGLRTDLGKLAGSLRTGEDHEFFLRLLRAGCRGVYEPGALVGHVVPAERMTRGYFRRWIYRNGHDVARLERSYAAAVPFLFGVPRYLWRQTIADALSAVRAAIGGDDARRFASGLRVLWFAGYLRESLVRPYGAGADRVHAGGRTLSDGSSAARPAITSPGWNVLVGTATKYAVLAVNLGLGIVLLPFTVRHLGTADYGLWMLVASLTYYFQVLDLGYGNGVVRHVVDADARGDITGVNNILSTFVVVYAGLGLLTAAGTIGLIFWAVPNFPHLSALEIRRGQLLLAIMGLRIAVGFPMTVFGAVTTARQRFALNNAVAIVVALVNGLATYIVLVSGHGLVALVATTTAVGLASYAGYAWTARRAFPDLRLRPSSFNPRLVRDVTSFSLYLFIVDIAVQIGFNLDNLVIGVSLGTSAVAVYAVTLRLADYQRQLCNQFNGFLFSVAVRYGAGGRADRLESLLIEGTRIALILVTGVTIAVIGFGGRLLVLWMGPGFEAGIAPLYVLAAAGVVLVGQGPLGNILLATGRHRLVAYVSLGEALANLLLSVMLVRRFGILGVAVGTAVPVVLANLFILMPAACHRFQLPTLTFLRLVLAAPATGAVPAIAACAILRFAYPPSSLAAILAEGVCVGLVYGGAIAAFGFDRRVRARYLDYVRRMLVSPRRGDRTVAAGLS
jgi:O-antigen/teichoic acid export membrane protein/glycosyltransferase involved in cell wall biosynthesis